MQTEAVRCSEDSHVLKSFLGWCRKQYWLALLPALPILLTRFYYPALLDNEAGKLIEARRMIEPAFLGNDWLQMASREDVLYGVFSALVAPFWVLLKNAILVALVGRLLIWALLLYALLRLARAMEVEGYALAVGLATWLFCSQTMGANEWIFGGIESKCVAYALLFLGLESALRKRVVAAAVYCGFAIWLHVLVGGWGAMALGGAVLICGRSYGWRRALQFGAITGAFLLPLAWVFLHSTSLAEGRGSADEANRLIVLFRNPHHLDPWFFHGKAEFVILCLLAGVTAFGLCRLIAGPKAALIRWFLVILLLQFGAGLVARRLGAFWFLKYYPFRVADVLVGLFFWLTLPMLLVWLSRGGVLSRFPAKFRSLGWCLVLLAFTLVVVVKSAPVMKRHLGIFAESWSRYIRHDESGWVEATDWIRWHTPASAVIIAPPWEGTFWIDAERAEVVNFKRAPHSRAILEWNRRMMALNGGPFHECSDGVLDELQRNYPELDAATVAALGKRYGADYYLTTRRRLDLAGRLVHENPSYFLYQLSR
jgi:hypothetical protein